MTLLSSFTRSLNGFRPFGGSAIASSSSSPLTVARPTASPAPTLLQQQSQQQTRQKSNLAPKRTKYRKAHKGRVSVPTGGSIKGTTLSHGEFGIRLLSPARLSAKVLTSAEVALKRHLKVVKGAQVFLRLFPDIPVCVKGNETRMGKGKGAFDHWSARGSVGKVVFEVGGPVEIKTEVAKEALRLASAKLPVPTEFITSASGPRLGNSVLTNVPAGSGVAAEGKQAGLVEGAEMQRTNLGKSIGAGV
ncbi:unnamed protein product [Jaminaea pallidilutea]